MEFKDQYKHPAWQKRRLKSLSRSDFTCERCGDSESQLHVHHKRYVKGRMIWEYEDEELEVLCECCHQIAHSEKDQFSEFISRFPSEAILEFMAVLVGYSKIINGPSGFGDINDFFSSQELEPCSVECGYIAAILNNRMDIYSLIDLHKKIRSTPSGDAVTFTLPIKKRFVHGEN